MVSGSPSLACPATTSSPAGAYEIVPSQGTLNASNYTFDHFVNGTLTVWPAGALKLSAFYSQGQVHCTVTGPADARFYLQASSDLEVWAPMATNTIPAGGSVTICDPDSSSNQDRRFYRAILAAESPLMPPVVIRQPDSQTAVAGSTVVFDLEVKGSPLAYQWQFNGVNIPGATSPTLQFASVQLADAGHYTVVISNAAGSVTSLAAALKVVPATTAVLIASALNNPSFLAIDGGNLFFADNTASDGIIKTVSQNGGSVATLYNGVVLPENGGYRCLGYLLAEGSKVYGHYGSYDNMNIFSGPESGGTLTTLVSLRGGSLIGVIGNDLYYSMGFSTLNKMSKSGGASSQVASGYFIRGTACDPEAIYFVDYSTRNVYKCSLASGAVTPMITGNTAESSLFLDAQYLYQNLGGSIRRVAKSGGQTETLFTGTTGYGGYASDGTYVYFETKDAINYIPAGGGLPTQLISIPPGSLTSLIVDKTSVYWTDISAGAGSGNIWRMPKP